MGRILEFIEGAPFDVRDAYLRAYEVCPHRAEAPHALAFYNRNKGWHNTAYVFARLAVNSFAQPDDLFTETEAYTWRSVDELALAAFFTGQYAEASSLNEALLHMPELPDTEKLRIQSNLRVSEENLSQ